MDLSQIFDVSIFFDIIFIFFVFFYVFCWDEWMGGAIIILRSESEWEKVLKIVFLYPPTDCSLGFFEEGRKEAESFA